MTGPNSTNGVENGSQEAWKGMSRPTNLKRLMSRTLKFSSRALTLAVIATFALACNPQSVESQVVQGRLMEVETGIGVTSGWVMLLDTAFAVAASAITNQTGMFRVEAPEAGSYYVLTEALGYAPLIDGILDLGEGGSISVELHVQPKPIVLDSMLVAVERALIFQHLEKSGFNERQATGFGHFITPEEIQRRQPAYFSDLFRTTPGISLVGGGSMGGTQILFRNASIRGGTCSPPVYVDGILVNTEFGGLESVVDLRQVAAIEVYTRASNVPSQWGGTNAGCGILLIWTR